MNKVFCASCGSRKPLEYFKSIGALSCCPERKEVVLAADYEQLQDQLNSIHIYGSDTLTGNAHGPNDYKWYRDGVREMMRRAALKGDE